jgi:fimbrial chaperone protein
VRNAGSETTLVQLDLFRWSQVDGDDVLDPTEELVAAPRVLSLEPGEERTVRVGALAPNRTAIEATYRVFVRELAPSAGDESQIRFTVRIGVPLFAAPTGSATTPSITWRIVAGPDKCQRVRLDNPAASHVHILNAELVSADGAIWSVAHPDYVLPHSQRLLQPTLCTAVSESAALRITTDSGVLNLNAPPHEANLPARPD